MVREPTTSPRSLPDAACVCLCDNFDSLINAGMSESVELALWQRETASKVGYNFHHLDYSRFHDFRIEGDGGQILAAASAFLNDLRWPKDAIGVLLSDIIEAVGCSILQASRYGLRLEYVTGDACRKFHKDRTDIRLITTYLGRGTQWIDTGTSEAEPAVQELRVFDVGMFLGERDDRPSRIFHRSPPIADTGSARFMMVLDIER